jgi:hypothetical protein
MAGDSRFIQNRVLWNRIAGGEGGVNVAITISVGRCATERADAPAEADKAFCNSTRNENNLECGDFVG